MFTSTVAKILYCSCILGSGRTRERISSWLMFFMLPLLPVPLISIWRREEDA